jgi:hypothetical protein
MMHSRSGAVRQHVAGSCAWWRLEQAGNANGVVNLNTDRVGHFSHELIPHALCHHGLAAEISCNAAAAGNSVDEKSSSLKMDDTMAKAEESSAGSDIRHWPLEGIPIVPIHF